MSQTVITRDRDTRVVVVRERSRVETVVTERAPVEIVQRGRQGPPGPAGTSGDGLLPAVNFAFGDASSVVVTTTADDSVEVTRLVLEIETPFNGTGATISVGTLAQPTLLMTTEQNTPYIAATFDLAPGVELSPSTGIYLTINAGTASQGSGKLVISTAPIS